MSKRSRRRARGQARPQPQPQRPHLEISPPPTASEPERLLLDQIAAGALDPHLTAIADAIDARQELLETINS